jgi:hypothetical protein
MIVSENLPIHVSEQMERLAISTIDPGVSIRGCQAPLARSMTVRVPAVGKIAALLTGYAYETVPNKVIIAGKMQSVDSIEAAEPVSLGRLAQGSAGLAAWRSGKYQGAYGTPAATGGT